MDSSQLSIILSAVDQASGQLKAVNNSLKELGAGAEESNAKTAASGINLQKLGSVAGDIGTSLDKYITLPILGIGAAAIKATASFQQNMELIRTQAGASQKEVDSMSKSVLDLAKHSEYGPTELSKALFYIESAGFRGAKAMDVLKLSSEGASVGQADLQATTNVLTSIMNTHIAGAENATAAMGNLNAIVGAGKMRFDDLNAAMSTGVVDIAASAGVSLQSLGAAIAELTNKGVPAVDAATHLRMMITLMESPTSKAAKALQAMGLSATESGTKTALMKDILDKSGVTFTKLAEDLKKPNGISAALTDLKDHLEKAGFSSQQTASLIEKSLGGVKAGTTAVELTSDLGGLNDRFKQVGASAGDFAGSVAAQQQTASAKFHAAWATIQADMVEVGQSLLPTVMSALKSLVGILTNVFDSFNKLNGPTKTFVLTMFGVLAAVGPMLKIFSAFVSVGSLTAKALDTLGFSFFALGDAEAYSALQMGLATAGISIAIGLLVVALSYLITHWQQVLDWIRHFWNENQKYIIAFVAIFMPEILAIVAAADLIIKNWKLISTFFKQLWEDVKEYSLDIWQPIEKASDNAIAHLKQAWTQVKDFFVDLWQTNVAIVEAIPKKITATWDTIKTNTENAWKKITDAIGNALDALTSKKTYLNFADKIVSGMVNYDESHITQWYNNLDKLWQTTEKWAKTLPKKINDAFDQNFWFPLKSWFDDKVTGKDSIPNQLDKWWQAFDKWFKTLPKQVNKSFDDNIWFPIKNWFSDRATGKDSIPIQLDLWWQAFDKWLKTLPSKFATELGHVKEAIVNWFKNLPKELEKDMTQSGNDMGHKHTESFGQIWKDSGTIGKIGAYIVLGIVGAIALIIGTLVVAIVQLGITLVKAFLKVLQDIYNDVVQWGKDLIRWIVEGVNSAISGISKMANDIWNAIKNAFKDAGTWLYNAGKDLISGMMKGAEDGIGSVGKDIGNIGDKVGHAIGKALHIPGLAIGTPFAIGGRTVVGEHGAEIVDLPTGARVMNAQQTQQTLGSGSGDLHVHIHAGVFAGQPGEMDKVGAAVYQSIMRIARQHGNADLIPNIGVLPT